MRKTQSTLTNWPMAILLAAAINLVSFQAQAEIFHTGTALYRSALGGTVTLNQDIEVLRGARIHIQYGRVMEYRDLRQLEPYCYFYSLRGRNALSEPFRVESGQFKITGVERRREIGMAKPVKLASLATSMFNGDGGGMQYTLATRFHLDSPEQPDLSSLVCGVWASPNERGYPTLAEIQKTLGNLVQFEIPSQ